MSSHFVSVIVPVFNDSERLKLCLQALENQTYPKHSYEIIVVDNNSDEDISEVVQQFSQTSFTSEKQPGSYAARNQGISVAKGDILAFTDSDCIPMCDWIEKGVASLLSAPDCGLAAGKIRLFFKDPDQPTAVELYESVTAFRQEKYVEESKFGVTANLFTFKTVVNSVGPFNATLKSSGDLEWGNRVFEAGYKQVYASDACVDHPARSSLKQLHKKTTRVIGGKYDLQENKKYPLNTFLKILVIEVKWILEMILYILPNQSLNGFISKFKVIFVVLFTGYTKIKERICLQIKGGLERESNHASSIF